MSAASNGVWEFVHAERRRLADDLAGLDEAQWHTASLCPGWDVHDVLAHLVDTARTSRLSFVREMVMARGNFDRANARGISREKRPDPRDTLASFRAAADLTRTPPANRATRVVEAIVHGEDIRRPVGIVGIYPDKWTAEALRYQLATAVSFGGGRERAAGLRLVDTSTDTSWGEGDEVRARGVDLLLAVSGRPVDFSQFTGPGVERLRSSLATD